MDFSLNNFKKTSSEKLPNWALKSKRSRELYETFKSLAKEIEDKIKHHPELQALSKSQRKITAVTIGQKLNIDPSSIRKDRYTELLEDIDNTNAKFERLYLSLLGHPTDGKQKSRSDLEEENKKLKQRLEAAQQKNLHEFFDRAIQSEVLGTKKEWANKYKELKYQYDELQVKLSNVQEQNRQLIKELNK